VASATGASRIASLVLPGVESADGGLLSNERNTAIADLARESYFQPVQDDQGPYAVQLTIEESRLVLRLQNVTGDDLPLLALSLSPYRRLIQDYFLMVEGYEESRRSATREKLEAIDMGRRALHNEGAKLLMERLREKIDMDFETARRLFTLICVLNRNFARLS
jgi:uncharacterized protein (UPF0262 family)